MHTGELLGDRVLRSILLLRQPLDSPDLGKKLANFLSYILAILLGHESPGSTISLLEIHLISDTAFLDTHSPIPRPCQQWAPAFGNLPPASRYTLPDR